MMKFVCLLRGINVGGKNKVDMKKLKTVMEQNGFKNALTYINSGNIIFESDHQHILNHQDHIHDLILKTFQVDSKTLVITKDDFIQITEHIPKHYKNDHEFKSDVLFYYQ